VCLYWHTVCTITIIQPHRLEQVKEQLYKAQVNLITVNEVLGHGRQKGITEVYRGFKETGNLLRKVRLEIAVNDNFVESTIKAIIKGRRPAKWATARYSLFLWKSASGYARLKQAARRLDKISWQFAAN